MAGQETTAKMLRCLYFLVYLGHRYSSLCDFLCFQRTVSFDLDTVASRVHTLEARGSGVRAGCLSLYTSAPET
jgi:hypothetical protein